MSSSTSQAFGEVRARLLNDKPVGTDKTCVLYVMSRDQRLREVECDLALLNIPFMLSLGKAAERLHGVLYRLKPQAVYFDFSPLRLHQTVADEADCAVFEVDTHNIVPAWIVSDHQEVGARTLRPKLQRLLPEYLEAVGENGH